MHLIRRFHQCVVAAFLIAIVVALGQTPAYASTSRPRFTRAATLPSGALFLTNGRYDYLPRALAIGFPGTLVDEATGQRVAVSRPGCFPDLMGGPWLLFACEGPDGRFEEPGGPYALYNIAQRHFTVVNAGFDGIPQAVGRYWIDFEHFTSCPDGPPCQNTSNHAYQNIESGRVVQQGTLPLNTVPDLSARHLAARLCAPLQPPTINGFGSAPFALYGRFALATGTPYGYVPQTYLQQCGSSTKRILYSSPEITAGYAGAFVAVPTNPHLIVWGSSRHRLTALFLPSLRRVTIDVPARVGPVKASTGNLDQIYLTARWLYLQDQATLYRTAIPNP